MPFILALLSAAAVAYFWFNRARNAADIAGDLANVANDVRLAARRFGFRRRANIHPVESIEDPDVAVAALAAAFLELDDLPTAEQRAALEGGLARSLALPQKDAAELTVLGHWFVGECGTPGQAVARISRKLFKLNGADSFEPLMDVLGAIAAAGNGLSYNQKDALEDVKRAFQIR